MTTISFPPRLQFHNIAREAFEEVLSYYEEAGKDFGSQGYFENEYTQAFCHALDPQTHGYADAVCSGTAAIYVALQALELKKGSFVLVSAITDPGMINPIIVSGLTPKLIDNEQGKPYPSLSTIKSRYTPGVSAIILNHLAGIPIQEIQEICIWAREHNIKLIEDCSQAHFAHINGNALGTFGDIACFSTMFSKSHSTGGRGGIIYTKDLTLFQKVRMYSDKGKASHVDQFNEKDPNTFLLPALNLNIDEISCAIGKKSLEKLPEVINKRIQFLKSLQNELLKHSTLTRIHSLSEGISPFFWILHFDESMFNISKIEFAEALKKAGLPLNTHYPYIVYEWPWVKKFLADEFIPENAIDFRNSTFNLLFNENFGDEEARMIAATIANTEKIFYKT